MSVNAFPHVSRWAPLPQILYQAPEPPPAVLAEAQRTALYVALPQFPLVYVLVLIPTVKPTQIDDVGPDTELILRPAFYLVHCVSKLPPGTAPATAGPGPGFLCIDAVAGALIDALRARGVTRYRADEPVDAPVGAPDAAEPPRKRQRTEPGDAPAGPASGPLPFHVCLLRDLFAAVGSSAVAFHFRAQYSQWCRRLADQTGQAVASLVRWTDVAVPGMCAEPLLGARTGLGRAVWGVGMAVGMKQTFHFVCICFSVSCAFQPFPGMY